MWVPLRRHILIIANYSSLNVNIALRFITNILQSSGVVLEIVIFASDNFNMLVERINKDKNAIRDELCGENASMR